MWHPHCWNIGVDGVASTDAAWYVAIQRTPIRRGISVRAGSAQNWHTRIIKDVVVLVCMWLVQHHGRRAAASGHDAVVVFVQMPGGQPRRWRRGRPQHQSAVRTGWHNLQRDIHICRRRMKNRAWRGRSGRHWRQRHSLQGAFLVTRHVRIV